MLRVNVIAAIVATTAALVLIVVLVEDPLIEHRETIYVRAQLEQATKTALLALQENGAPDQVADRLGAATATRITIADHAGAVVGDTAYDGEALQGRRLDFGATEVARAHQSGQGFARRVEEGVGPMLHFAVRSPKWIVRASRPESILQAGRRSFRDLLVVGGMAAVALGVVLAAILSRTMIRPLEELIQTTDSLARGDLSVRTGSKRIDEFGSLGRAFDRMADQLEERWNALRSEEVLLRAVLDSAAEAVVVTDGAGRIVLTNRAFASLHAQEVMSTADDLPSEDLRRIVRAGTAGATASEEVNVEINGEMRTFLATVTPLSHSGGVVAVLYETTAIKRSDRIRRDFVANASHELRTPLTAIRGFVETLRDGGVTDPDTASRFLDTILKHTHRLQRLVDDLLALSRAESPEEVLELRPVDVASVALEAVRGLESQASERGILVRVETTPHLFARADERALDQVLVNLIDNAIKYTEQGGRVVVSTERKGTQVRITVSDTGPGIPAEQRGRIFERFYRIDKGRSRQAGGTGLGLSIVKHLVQRMKGKLDVESQPGEGTAFCLELTAAEVDRPKTGMYDVPRLG